MPPKLDTALERSFDATDLRSTDNLFTGQLISLLVSLVVRLGSFTEIGISLLMSTNTLVQPRASKLFDMTSISLVELVDSSIGLLSERRGV